jgi:hypothetical protein
VDGQSAKSFTYDDPDNHPSQASAGVIIEIILSKLDVDSLLDVGCGIGIWMQKWSDQGVSTVHGIDAPLIKQGEIVVPDDWITLHNLEDPFDMDVTYDLVTCLEVAEHIHEEYSDTLIDSLTRHSQNILFSAAIPGQGGVHHVNEQYQDYWIKKFKARGYQAYDVVRPATWNNPEVQFYYSQNCFLFSKEQTNLKEVNMANAVHPALFEKRTNDKNLSFGKILNHIPTYIIKSIRSRI